MNAQKKAKSMKKNDKFPSTIYALCALDDGRLAIGGSGSLIIYNMKKYKIDIYINASAKNLVKLKNNKLFYYTYYTESEGPWVDEIVDDYLIELSNNDYIDKTDILPKYSSYNIFYEYTDSIIFAGRAYVEQNNCIRERIEKLLKIDDKYKIVTKMEPKNLIKFILLKNNTFAILCPGLITFHDNNNFKCIQKEWFDKQSKDISLLNETFMFISTIKEVMLYDYINYKKIKKITCLYPICKIYINENNIFIGECEKRTYKKDEIIKNRIVEYEFDENNTNFIKVYEYFKPQNVLINFTQVKDGRIITCSQENIKIWS